MTVSVKNSDGNYSDDAKLYDASKNPLYVKEGDNYRLATYGDYRGGIFTTYYRKQESYLYTGWQTIDGKTYYFNNNNRNCRGQQWKQGEQLRIIAENWREINMVQTELKSEYIGRSVSILYIF